MKDFKIIAKLLPLFAIVCLGFTLTSTSNNISFWSGENTGTGICKTFQETPRQQSRIAFTMVSSCGNCEWYTKRELPDGSVFYDKHLSTPIGAEIICESAYFGTCIPLRFDGVECPSSETTDTAAPDTGTGTGNSCLICPGHPDYPQSAFPYEFDKCLGIATENGCTP